MEHEQNTFGKNLTANTCITWSTIMPKISRVSTAFFPISKQTDQKPFSVAPRVYQITRKHYVLYLPLSQVPNKG